LSLEIWESKCPGRPVPKPSRQQRQALTRACREQAPGHAQCAEGWLRQPVIPAATAHQSAPVVRRAPVPGHWCFSPATTASHNVNDTFCICIPCILHSCILHLMHVAFLHSVFQPQKRYSRPKLHSVLHSYHSAFHQRCIPHPGSLLFLTMQELCVVAVRRRCQAAVPSH